MDFAQAVGIERCALFMFSTLELARKAETFIDCFQIPARI